MMISDEALKRAEAEAYDKGFRKCREMAAHMVENNVGDDNDHWLTLAASVRALHPSQEKERT